MIQHILIFILAISAVANCRPSRLDVALDDDDDRDGTFRAQFVGKFTGAGDVEGTVREPFSTMLDSPQMFNMWKLKSTQNKMRNLQAKLFENIVSNEAGNTGAWFYGSV